MRTRGAVIRKAPGAYEGAGIVTAVGPNTPGFCEGDHVVAFIGAVNAIAVDPVAFKRETAEQLDATHSTATIEEAGELARSLTNGQGADSAIVTVGVTGGEHVGQAFASVRKAGTVVITGLGNHDDIGVPIPLSELPPNQKRLQGSLFGSSVSANLGAGR